MTFFICFFEIKLVDSAVICWNRIIQELGVWEKLKLST